MPLRGALGVALLRVAGVGAGDFLLGVSSFLRLVSLGDSMMVGVVVRGRAVIEVQIRYLLAMATMGRVSCHTECMVFTCCLRFAK